MQATGLFEQALVLERLWYVERTEFDAGERASGSLPELRGGGNVRLWRLRGRGMQGVRHCAEAVAAPELQAYLHAPSPRVECPECGVRQARLPWASSAQWVTLLFEALAMAMMTEMPVKAVARIVGEHDTRLWRIAKHYVSEARAAADHSEVRAVGVDEKASRRGHSYVTFFADLDERRLLYATEGRKRCGARSRRSVRS